MFIWGFVPTNHRSNMQQDILSLALFYFLFLSLCFIFFISVWAEFCIYWWHIGKLLFTGNETLLELCVRVFDFQLIYTFIFFFSSARKRHRDEKMSNPTQKTQKQTKPRITDPDKKRKRWNCLVCVDGMCCFFIVFYSSLTQWIISTCLFMCV